MRCVRWVSGVLAIALALLPHSVVAASPKAEALFLEACTLLEQYQTACKKLAKSQRSDPATRTHLNFADCCERLGKTATTWGPNLGRSLSTGYSPRTGKRCIMVAGVILCQVFGTSSRPGCRPHADCARTVREQPIVMDQQKHGLSGALRPKARWLRCPRRLARPALTPLPTAGESRTQSDSGLFLCHAGCRVSRSRTANGQSRDWDKADKRLSATN